VHEVRQVHVVSDGYNNDFGFSVYSHLGKKHEYAVKISIIDEQSKIFVDYFKKNWAKPFRFRNLFVYLQTNLNY